MTHMKILPNFSPRIIIPRDTLPDIRPARIVLLAAPPGSGKTVFAAQLAEKYGEQVIWHTVEEWQRDIPELHKAALQAFKPILPGIVRLAKTDVSSASTAARAVARFVRQHCETPLIYVIDDVHWLADHPVAEAWLKTLLRHLPAHCRVILAGHKMPALEAPRYIAAREIMAIPLKSLRFSESETRLLATFTRPYLTDEQIHALTAHFAGWPAGIAAALQAQEYADTLTAGDASQMFRQVVEHLLQTLPPELRYFLLDISTLDVITQERCIQGLRIAESPTWLVQIRERCLFLHELPHGLVLHDLFRDYLQDFFKRTNPERLGELHRSLAAWFEEDDDYSRAFHHWLEAGEVQKAAAIAERVAHAYQAAGRWQVLIDFARRLEGTLAETPGLMVACGMIATDRRDYLQAARYFEQAEKIFFERHDMAGLCKTGIFQAVLDVQQGHYQEALARLAHWRDNPVTPENLLPVALHYTGMALVNTGDLVQGLNYLNQALPLYKAQGDVHAICSLLQSLSYVYTCQGQLSCAETVLTELVGYRRQHDNRPELSRALNSLGYHYHLQERYEAAAEVLDEGWQIASALQEFYLQGWLEWSLGDLSRDRGDFVIARQWYHLALNHASEDGLLRCGILLSLARLCQWQSEVSTAIRMGTEALNMALEQGHTANVATARILLAGLQAAPNAFDIIKAEMQALLEQQTLLRAVQSLGTYLRAARSTEQPETLNGALVLVDNLRRQAGSLQPFIAEVFHSSDLHELVTASRDIAALARLEEAQAHRHQVVSAEPGTPRSLRVNILGYERLERDGTTVAVTEWESAAARELFYYLVLRGAQRREELYPLFENNTDRRHNHRQEADILKRVRRVFDATLHRARNVLGKDTILYEEGRYFINPAVNVKCDALQLLDYVRKASHRPLSPDAMECWHKAVELYEGDLLPDFDSLWLTNIREACQKAYVQALIGCADFARRRGDFGCTIGYLQLALKYDPCNEALCRYLMRDYARLGQIHDVIRVMDELETRLAEDLDVSPSQETFDLYQQLVNKR